MKEGEPLLTIGMATFDDFEGVWYSIQALRTYHKDQMPLCELIVVDNNPTSKDGQATKSFIEGACRPIARYVPFTVRGSCPPRGHLFDQAKGQWVLCIDSHVFIEPGGIANLVEWIRQNPDSRDLIHGPMVSNALNGSAEAMMVPQWRSEMFGTWAKDDRTKDHNGEPFEIPMHGLGIFAMRRDAWPGFHPELLGFSGGEGYIHEKVRQRGGRVLCHPGIRWLHKFQRHQGVPHRPQREEKIANVLRGWSELGMDLQAIVDHFAGGVGMRENRPCITEAKLQEIVDRIATETQVEATRTNLAGFKVQVKKTGAPKRAGIIVGPYSYGAFQMRGKPLMESWHWPAKNSRGRVEIKHQFEVGLAVKCVPPPVMREHCDRLILDVMDLFWSDRRQMEMQPAKYWQALHQRANFDELITTSPASQESAQAALPGVKVWCVPHAADPRVEPGWRDPDGPIVYAGGRVFVEKYKPAITEAVKRLGKEMVWCHDHHAQFALKGASLCLAIRLPPYATSMNNIAKPQVKVANAAVAGIPVLCTETETATTSTWPDLADVAAPLDAFNSPATIVPWLERALEHAPPQEVFTHEGWMATMKKVIAG